VADNFGMPSTTIKLQRQGERYLNRDVASATGVSVHGLRDLTGPSLEITVKFDSLAWEDWEARRLTILPVGAHLTIHSGSRSAALGWCRPLPGSTIAPCRNPTYEQLVFIMPLTHPQLEQVEELRSGNELRLEVRVTTHVFIIGDMGSFDLSTVSPPVEPILDKEWTRALADMGGDEHVWVDIPTPSGRGIGGAAEFLRKALEARSRGDQNDAVARCRPAIKALAQGGFGGRTESEVIRFIKDKGSQLTKRERVAVLRAAVEIFTNPANHPETHHEEFSRKEATASVALVAAVLSLAEVLGPDPAARLTAGEL
jgi:hypothetical protein